ncbi:uncharacterized protein LOC131302825 [Rhododendron vialii]|uniref:uncharacterized protein LOC131302825 n=1 Tax=Rhododendron vialii TaxID=182163 RepID=UPI00265F967A|nr:uncharacterized protein LOC131302825 [Rhododendron vialii]
MKNVVGKVVSESQNAFVQGRQILDAVLVANECVDSRLKSGTPGIACKLDIEKAYDHPVSFRLLEDYAGGSPSLLFIVVMEVLSCMIQKAVQGGFLEGFKVGRVDGARLMVSHILYADDTLLFCNADLTQVGYLR